MHPDTHCRESHALETQKWREDVCVIPERGLLVLARVGTESVVYRVILERNYVHTLQI